MDQFRFHDDISTLLLTFHRRFSISWRVCVDWQFCLWPITRRRLKRQAHLFRTRSGIHTSHTSLCFCFWTVLPITWIRPAVLLLSWSLKIFVWRSANAWSLDFEISRIKLHWRRVMELSYVNKIKFHGIILENFLSAQEGLKKVKV